MNKSLLFLMLLVFFHFMASAQQTKRNRKKNKQEEYALPPEGEYAHGARIGTWTFYKHKDTVEQKYDFTNKKLIYFLNDATKKYSVINGSDTTLMHLDRPPLMIGGSSTIQDLLVANLRYPDAAREDNMQGRVTIAILVDAQGNPSKPWVQKSVYPALDHEALRVVAMLPHTWLPGLKDAKPVASIFVLPISFNLE